MEEEEVTDYSSDRMTGDDIWVGSEGLDLDDLMEFPRLGSEMPLPADLVMESPLSGLSPSEVITSPGQTPCDLPPARTGEQRVDLLGDASWREAGVFFSNALGFPAVPAQGGFAAVSDFDKVAEEGVARQVQELLGCGSSGHAVEEDSRAPLDSAEQRGFASPERDSGQREEPTIGDDGAKKGGNGSVKKRRKRWIKIKEVKNYAVGEDID